jgi:hypothetical protein
MATSRVASNDLNMTCMALLGAAFLVLHRALDGHFCCHVVIGWPSPPAAASLRENVAGRECEPQTGGGQQESNCFDRRAARRQLLSPSCGRSNCRRSARSSNSTCAGELELDIWQISGVKIQRVLNLVDLERSHPARWLVVMQRYVVDSCCSPTVGRRSNHYVASSWRRPRRDARTMWCGDRLQGDNPSSGAAVWVRNSPNGASPRRSSQTGAFICPRRSGASPSPGGASAPIDNTWPHQSPIRG